MKRIFPVLFLAILAACNQSPLLPEGTLSGPAGTISLSAAHHLSGDLTLAANADGSKVLTNDLGFRITLTHGEVHFQRLSLVSSGDDPECGGGQDATVVLSGSDDLLGEDFVETSLGDHAIPLATFCSFELSMGLHLAGTWSKDGGAETPFAIEPEDAITASGPFEHPLHFHEGETETMRTFGVCYDALFDGVDFEGAFAPETIADNLAAALEVHSAH